MPNSKKFDSIEYIWDEIFIDNLGDIIGPKKYGADYPPVSRLNLNERNIPHNMRFREAHTSFETRKDRPTYKLIWETQEPFDENDTEEFLKEVNRCIKDNIEYYNIEEAPSNPDAIPQLYVQVTCRDGKEDGYYDGIIDLKTFYDKDTIIEDFNRNKIYFGFKGGEGGDYFDTDYFEIIKGNDGKYTWEECGDVFHSDESFVSEKEAINDAISKLTPDDGSEMLIGRDPDELYDRIFNNEVKYWISYGPNRKELKDTDKMSEEELIKCLDEYVSNYLITEVHSTDNDISANYNF